MLQNQWTIQLSASRFLFRLCVIGVLLQVFSARIDLKSPFLPVRFYNDFNRVYSET